VENTVVDLNVKVPLLGTHDCRIPLRNETICTIG
jgi:hypothetical protein